MNFIKRHIYLRQNRKAARLFRRGLFVYRYNSKLIVIDPVVVYKSLRAVGYENVGKAMENALDESNPSGLEKFFEVMHNAFGVEPISKTKKGMSVREMADMLTNFFGWLSDVKKNITSTPESARSMGSKQSLDTAGSQDSSVASTEQNTENSSLDSQKTLSPEPQPQDSQPTSGAEAPDTD